ncbi:MAG: prepilin-type N-terminal cleavage/methylation domain-containing protein [Deltaproteobacteria bacterium]|nr:prepilin-type N-terminal cleavage/methylation domain-containing protein [Deltaproteobacteria bacterium]
MTRRVRRQAGFTLLELLVSMAILSFMMVIAWATVSSTSNTKEHVKEVTERTHEFRVATAIIVRDLSHAYLSANEDQSITDRRTMFIGQPKGDVTALRFSSLAHRTIWADADESEQTLIAYYEAPDRQDSSLTNVIRHETRRLTNEQWESVPADKEVLLRNVEKFTLEYWDWRDNDWKERWDSTQADAETGRLPSRVRITVVAKLPSGNDITLTTQARIN